MYTFTVSLNAINMFLKCVNMFSKHKIFSLQKQALQKLVWEIHIDTTELEGK